MSRPGALVAVVVAALALGALRVGERDRSIALNGLGLDVPAGWQGESFFSRSGMAVLRVGSFTFPVSADDDVGQIARAAMEPDDVLINIVDYSGIDPRAETYRPVTPPLSVDGSKATGQEGYTVPAVIESVRVGERKLYLSVAFGRAPPSGTQVAAANAVLRTLRTS